MVNMEMNLQVPQKAGNFLISSATVSFSRTPLCRPKQVVMVS
jgi:hypothetical protein